MIPYVAVPYFNPDLSNFDATGAGIGNWVKIYLCNGANPGVPDLRGRVLVGTTTGMNGGTLNAAVDPAVPGNPAYSLGTTTGLNQVTLGPTQIPSHTHTITNVVSVTDPGHTHNLKVNTNAAGSGNPAFEAASTQGNFATDSAQTGVTVNVASTASSFGGGLPHQNNQPATGCYYIIYIP
jgi:microcystin-dependent protein